MFVGRTFSPAIGVAQSASAVSSHVFGILGAPETVSPIWRSAAKMADVHSVTRTKNVRISCMAVLTTEFTSLSPRLRPMSRSQAQEAAESANYVLDFVHVDGQTDTRSAVRASG